MSAAAGVTSLELLSATGAFGCVCSPTEASAATVTAAFGASACARLRPAATATISRVISVAPDDERRAVARIAAPAAITATVAISTGCAMKKGSGGSGTS